MSSFLRDLFYSPIRWVCLYRWYLLSPMWDIGDIYYLLCETVWFLKGCASLTIWIFITPIIRLKIFLYKLVPLIYFFPLLNEIHSCWEKKIIQLFTILLGYLLLHFSFLSHLPWYISYLNPPIFFQTIRIISPSFMSINDRSYPSKNII